MNEISAMPSAIAEWLGEREELNRMKFLTEFPPLRKAVPLKKITVAVGIGEISISDRFDENDDGVLDENEYCRQVEIKLRFSIHSPYSLGGQGCHEAFADIIDCLTFDSGLNIISSGCSNITEDRDTEAFVLNAHIFVTSSLCPAQSTDLVFPSFLDKTLLCGSHIRDENIHLSEQQQAYLSEPAATGQYMGNGTSARSIQLGFTPRALVVFAGGLPFIVNESGGMKIYFGCACGNEGSTGISIASNGFKVNDGSGYSREGGTPYLNRAGLSYSYIAWR